MADVLNGVTTLWERSGNGHADFWAKQGAKLHPQDELRSRAVQGLGRMARLATLWTAFHEAAVGDAGEAGRDTSAWP